jgi:hypothetical protein
LLFVLLRASDLRDWSALNQCLEATALHIIHTQVKLEMIAMLQEFVHHSLKGKVKTTRNIAVASLTTI